MCPHCGETDVRRSHRRRWRDFVHTAAGERPYRCRMCGKRFFGDSGHSREGRRQSKPKHRSRFSARNVAIQVAIFLVMLAAFFVFLRYITRERPGGEGVRITQDLPRQA